MRTRHVLSAAAVSAALVLSACGSDSDSSESSAAAIEPAADGSYGYPVEPTEPTPAAPVATDAPAAPSAPSSGSVQIVETDLGPVLADAGGFTLYVFTNDINGESTCFEDCIDAWPAAIGEPTTVEGVELVTIARPDGAAQLAIGDRPLYTYAGDAAPGDTAGHKVGEVWYAVGADGVPLS